MPQAGFEPVQNRPVPEQVRLCWMQLCNTDNHYTMAPRTQTPQHQLFSPLLGFVLIDHSSTLAWNPVAIHGLVLLNVVQIIYASNFNSYIGLLVLQVVFLRNIHFIFKLVASLYLLYNYQHRRFSSELADLIPFLHSDGWITGYSVSSMIFQSSFLDIKKNVHISLFLCASASLSPCTTRL